jgi:UDP-GlcNAc:undecaprenyl-phosphate GlcNAc-1-phosphate transferase
MDGLDGLAGGIGFQVMAWLLFCAAGQDAALVRPAAILAGALAGFLVWNMRAPWRKKAAVFLGDSGSLALGLALAWFTIEFSQPLHPVIHPVTVAWLLALPIYDTCGQFARRVSQGRHPFDADSGHFHHHFIYAGFTPGQATASIHAIAFVMAAFGVFAPRLGAPDFVAGYLWFALLLAHIYMSMRPHRFRRILSRLRSAS